MDKLIRELDHALRTLLAPAHSSRPLPGDELAESASGPEARRVAAALMRVNHSGEVSAQALYMGQMLTARRAETRQLLARSAEEEREHLAWCEARIEALGGRKSLLNPLWYAGAYTMGAVTGLMGDRWNLGFVAETERQVGKHLTEHLARLPSEDVKSRAVLTQMQADEAHHESVAQANGGKPLPWPMRAGMTLMGRIMTRSSYRI